MSRIEASPAVGPLAETGRSWSEWLTWVATEDHCEWANRYVYWLKTPLGVLVIGAFCSLLCGLFVAPQGFVLLAVIIAVIAVGVAWPLIAIRGISCRFVLEGHRGREGEASTAKLIVTNRWPWPVWGLSIDDPLLAADGESCLALARVEGWSTVTFVCSLTPTQRGVYPNREVRLGAGFPFGLYQASRPTEIPRHLIVWPRSYRLPPLGLNASRPHWRGPATDRRAGSEGARLGVRDHRAGDTLRDVHWAKSARYDRLIVNERESATIDEVTVIVETDPSARSDAQARSTLEWQLRIAASVCESVIMDHGQVDLLLSGTKRSAGRASGDLERVLDDLARFDPDEALESAHHRGIKPAGVVITIEARGSSIVLSRTDCVHQHGWIEIDAQDDVPAQLLRGWRLGKRGTRRAG